MKFKKLFEPINIGKVRIKNRIVMPSMCLNYAGPNGEVTEQDIAYYEARARGGVGLIIVDYACVSPEGRGMPGQRGIWDDKFIPGLSRLANIIKAYGAAVAIQLHHAGINSIAEDVVGPSRVSNKYFFITKPRELSTEEVEQLVEKYARAALRAKMAGFDMVEFHGTHGYLIAQFLSPKYNRRTDRYGRDRALFAIEIVERTKELCGKDFPVIFRLCADEFEDEGISLDYAKEVAKRLEDVGVDALNITGGNYDSLDLIVPNMYIEDEEEGVYRFFKLAAEIKKVVNIPVISGGLISDPEIAEKVLEDGMVDMVFIGRQLIADPEWPRKVKEGRVEDIRPCLACNEGCIRRIFNFKIATCAVNPLNGLEHRWQSEENIPKAKNKKKILIIGGGPAGLECARIAAIRGHDVTLVEKESVLGGTVKIAAVPPFKKRLAKLIKWYEVQLKKLGVKVMTNTVATPELIKKVNPDCVVIATGSEPLIPNIPGIENAVTADDILLGKVSMGENVVIIGGGLVGCETALYLAKQGKKVTIVEALPEVAADVEPTAKLTLLKRGGLFEKYGINIITKRPVVEIRKGEVVTVDEIGRRISMSADTIIIAVGRKPVIPEELVSEAKKLGKEVYIIGDAKEPRKIIDAIHEGFAVAINI